MPEQVHTKFEDEQVDSLTGYDKEPQKYSRIPSPTIEKAQIPQSNAGRQLQGVKRGRDGSPKSTQYTKSAYFPALLELENGEVGDGENVDKGDNVVKKQDVNGRVGKGEAVKVKDRIPTGLKPFYGTSQGSSHSSQSKRSPSVDSTVTKGGSENGITPQITPHSGTGNRVVNGRKANGSRKSSVDSDGSRDAPVGQRPSQQNLQRIKRDLLEARKLLPIWAHKADIRWALRHTDVLLLVGETGSGKSTQVPQFLTSEPWFKRQPVKVRSDDDRERKIHVGGMVAITEPRRVAATSLARRVAQETGSHLGKGQVYDQDQVGYSVRFDTLVPRNARIKFLTEGMLLQELLYDRYLRKYSAVIIDEIHERSVDVDLVTGFLRDIVRGDKSGRGGVPLKLVVMSATGDMDGLQKYFSEPSLVKIFALSGPNNGLSPTQEGAYANIKANDKFSQTHSDTTDRRVSNASYSSWDGIVSDDDNIVSSGPVEAPSSRAVPNGNEISESTKCSHESIFRLRGKNSVTETEHNDVVIHRIKGRQHLVKTFYTPEPVTDYVETTLKTIFKIHTQEPLPGDILAFLTGQEEIETLRELVQQYVGSLNKALPKLKVVCLYGHQSTEQQQEAFAGPGDKMMRKVVLATNIAETSITVPGIRFVIDCGKAKVKQHRARLGLQSLLVKPISKSSAIQRKGRAGREAPGKCYRLYTEAEYLKLHEVDIPEILRSDVVEAVLRMKAQGVRDVMSFPFLDPPDVDSIERALVNLHSIGALNDDGELNETGTKMAKFPLPAAYSRVLVAATDSGADCLLEVIDIIACLTASDDIFMQPKSDESQQQVEDTRRDLFRREGDIITYLTVMQKYASENSNRSAWCEGRLISARDMKQAISIRKQLRDMCVKGKMLADKPPPDPQPFIPITAERAEVLLKCFMKAFAMKTATLQLDGSYCTTIGKHLVTVHPSSVLHGKKLEAIMFLEHVYTQRNYAKKVNAVQINWIAEMLEMT